jgi:hypothetical protein
MSLRSRVRYALRSSREAWGFHTLTYKSRSESGSRARGGTATGVALLASVCLGACGTPSPDLFVVNRDGTVPGAKLTLLVSDQSARCNGAPAKPLTSAQILEARDLLRELIDLQLSKDAIPNAGAAQIFSYEVETEKGKIRYPDRQQHPEVLPRLTRFVRRVAIDTCGLRR